MTSIVGVDCHAHVIDPARFAYVAGQGYHPRADEIGTREDYFAVLKRHGISHGIVVQPSAYAFDNRATLDGIAASSGRCKGIAVVPVDVDDASLDRLQAAGIVGTRLNLGAFDPDFFERPGASSFLRRMAERGWIVQVCASAPKWPLIVPMLLKSGAIVIVDHLGEPDVGRTVTQPGFESVLALGRAGRAYIKLAAPYRLSHAPAPFADLTPFAHAALDAFGIRRCIWGSDWPFLNAGKQVSYAEQLDWLARVIPDATDRRCVLVDNPIALYGLGRSLPAGLA